MFGMTAGTTRLSLLMSISKAAAMVSLHWLLWKYRKVCYLLRAKWVRHQVACIFISAFRLRHGTRFPRHLARDWTLDLVTGTFWALEAQWRGNLTEQFKIDRLHLLLNGLDDDSRELFVVRINNLLSLRLHWPYEILAIERLTTSHTLH